MRSAGFIVFALGRPSNFDEPATKRRTSARTLRASLASLKTTSPNILISGFGSTSGGRRARLVRSRSIRFRFLRSLAEQECRAFPPELSNPGWDSGRRSEILSRPGKSFRREVAMTHTAGEIAQYLGARLEGDALAPVSGVASPD